MPGEWEGLVQLAGQRVVILGGTGGFGLATAELASQAGADLVIASPSQGKVDSAVAGLGPKARGYVVDARDEAALERFFAELGPFDHLVMTMGDPIARRPFLENKVATAKDVFDVRFWAQYSAVRIGAPTIARTGSITMTSAAGSMRAMPNGVLAGALASAVQGMVRQLAVELAPVRVNAVAPGFVDTPMYAAIPEQARQAFFAEKAAGVPLRRVGAAKDVAEAFMFLLGNQFSTGTTVYVDGGLTA